MRQSGSLIPFVSIAVTLAAVPALLAADPPPLIHYQGVLRGASGAPLTGAHDMVFRFYETPSGGSEILVDGHLAANAQAVVVDSGLFAVGLGSGQVADGSGPGTFTSLADLFRDHAAVWLEVQIGAETLSPRTRVLSSGYALSAGTAGSANQLEGRPAGFFLDTSADSQSKAGSLRVESSDASHLPLEAVRTGGAAGAAGYFEDNAYTGRAWLAEGHRGLRARGDEYGGFFDAPYWGSSMYAALDNTGIWANAGFRQGSCAGRFRGYYDGSGHNAELGCNGGAGVDGYGNPGGHFRANWGGSGEAWLGYIDDGIVGHGLNAGGFFADLNSSGYVYTGALTYKVLGNGAVSFVQNHPEEDDEVIVYHAPEASEVAVYTRGTARLVKGEARVALDRTFAWVTNPDIGLTAHITPRGEPIAISVSEATPRELVVRGPAESDAAFDYIVYGLRIGFEEMSVVQKKSREAYIPSMADHRMLYETEPVLRGYNALERFKAMEAGVHGAAPSSFPRADALKAAIQEYDPAVHGPVGPASGTETDGRTARAQPLGGPAPPVASTRPVADGARERSRTGPVAAREVEGTRDAEVIVQASESIEAGDLLVLDDERPGLVRRAATQEDPAVIGVAAAASAVVDDLRTVALEHRIYGVVRADAGYGGIRPGDLLVSSPTPGHGMRTLDPRPGTVIGKALEPLEAGTGLIRVLLMAR